MTISPSNGISISGNGSKGKDKTLLLLPEKIQDEQVTEWCITDQEGNIVKDKIKEISINDIDLTYNAYGDVDSKGQRIYNINDIKIGGKPIK